MWTRHAVSEGFSARGKTEHWLGFRKTNGWSSGKEPLMQWDIANILYILVKNEIYMAWLYPMALTTTSNYCLIEGQAPSITAG